MTSWQTIRVRLLGAFGLVTLTTAIAVIVSLIGLNATMNAVAENSERRLPESSAANQLALQIHQISNELTALARAPDEQSRAQVYSEYKTLSTDLDGILKTLAGVASQPRVVSELTNTVSSIDQVAQTLNQSQQDFLQAKARREQLLEESKAARSVLEKALEDAIDGANEMDVETYLRTNLAATMVAAHFSDVSSSFTEEDVDVVAEMVSAYADDISINFAILGDVVPANAKESATSFLDLADGEEGLFGARKAEIRAAAAADQARISAEKIKGSVSFQVGTYVDNVREIVSDKSAQTLTMGERFKLIQYFVAAISISLSFLIGWFYVSGSLLKRMSGLSRVMQAVSAGDLDAKIEGAQTNDELGEMASALEVFRGNARNMEKLNKEKAEADKIAWEEKERAREREAEREKADKERVEAERRANEEERKAMMRRLRKAFGAVVDAATAGDFSQRVDDRFDNPELNELADGLNTLASTVQTGLRETRQVLEAVARYDLSRRVEGDYEGEFQLLKEGVNRTADNLTDVVGQLQGSSNNLRDATADLLNGANDLANRASQQAATIEETSAATEQLARSVQENAERAQQASTNASKANKMAHDGGQIMQEATSAIDRIAASSSKISDIIGLIDSIAFQTNLLSLNASVEAARAGEAGSGFAVVASEVRSLAQSASAASKEIKELIDEGADDVRQGVELVSKVADSLDNIVKTVGDVTQLMNATAEDNREQVASLNEINGAVRHMDQMIQHNAALASQTQNAIATANERVNDLDELARGFKTSQHDSSIGGDGNVAAA